MDKIKTSDLIVKLALASEEACKCEDDNFNRRTRLNKMGDERITVNEVMDIVRAISDFNRFASMRATCKVLQELGLIESDVDVFDNDAFLEQLKKAYLG